MPATGSESPRAGGPQAVSSDEFGMLTREELLGGLPARRASTLLFAIESRTAHLVVRSRRAMARHLTERTAEEQERAFLSALAQGRDLPLRPTIQDLERYAPEWASLVPDDDALKASVARMLGERYPMVQRIVPGIREALGLESAPVGQAFERLHQRPLESIYAPDLPWRERLRWARSRAALRLETLPPFWTAFALTLTETVGAGILALPIALADIGPLPGLIVIVVLGLVNVLTIAAIAEAAARNGNVRYGQAYFARLVADNLGRPAAWVLNATMLALAVFLVAYFIGLASTLADATRIPQEVCVLLIVLVMMAVLRRESLDATVASALVVGAVSISLVTILSVIALISVEGANLRHVQVPFIDGEPFDGSVLELVFGVVLLAYFGHTSAGNCAAVVLRRDPSARSFIRGSGAAMLTAVGLYGLWVVAVNGAVSPDDLANETGTALVPLAAEIGPVILVLGSVFAVLAMGMASIHMALGLFNQTREWLAPVIARTGEDRRWRAMATSREGRFWLSAAPILAIFLIVEALMITDRESFTEPLSFLGAITSPVLAGVFPMLMVVAARRKGDCAIGPVGRLVGHPVAVAVVTLPFLGALVLHGAVIWESPLQRAAALLAAIVSIAVSVAAWRRGAFRPRTVVELRVGPDDEPPVINVVTAGHLVPAAVRFEHEDERPARFGGNDGAGPGGLRSASIDLPPSPARELKVWAHRLTPEGDSERLAAALSLRSGEAIREFDLDTSTGQVIVPVSGEPQQLEMTVQRRVAPSARMEVER